jgi:hypothetical protein
MKSLLGRRILFLSLLFLLTACAGTAADDDSVILETLTREGVLAPFNIEETHAFEFELVQVERGDLIVNWGAQVLINFPHTYHMNFEAEQTNGEWHWLDPIAFEHGLYSGTTLRVGDFVSEGDFIAELTFNMPESLAISRQAHFFERSLFETNFRDEQNRRLIEIENLRAELEISPDTGWEITALRLERALLAYDRFMISSTRRMEDFDRQLEELERPIQNERLYAPVDGRVVQVTQRTQPGLLREVPQITGSGGRGTTRDFGRRIVTIMDSTQGVFTVQAELHALRFGDVIQLTDQAESFTFDMRVATDPMTQNIRREGNNHTFRLLPVCEDAMYAALAEAELSLYDLTTQQLRARSTVPVGINVVIVPRRAVIEENNRHFVMLYDDGEMIKRYVDIGPTVGGVIQILAGLEPGQWVVTD